MKKTILSALIPLFMATSAAFGAVMIQFTDNVGIATAGSYNSTDTFSFDVYLNFTTPPANVRGLSYWFEVPTALAPFITITNETFFTFTLGASSAPHSFNDASGADSGFLAETGDLGGVISNQSNFAHVAPGIYKVASITFSLSGAPAGTYTLESTTLSPKTSEATEDSGANALTSFPMAAAAYTITIVPEPGTLSLLGLGGLASLGLTVLRARRRR
jgi:hypothetical protein